MKYEERIMNRNKYTKGFTLMEVLVATIIFVMVMVIATGIIAQGSSYGGKIKRLRETSEEARRLADMITRDIKAASAPVTLNASTQGENAIDTCDDALPESGEVVFKSGLAILAYRDWYNADYVAVHSHCIEYFDSDGISSFGNHGSYDSHMLIIGMKDKVRVYLTNWSEGPIGCSLGLNVYRFYMKDFPAGTVLTINDLWDVAEADACKANAITSANYNVVIGFGGYAPITSSSGVGKPSLSPIFSQPVVKFLVTVQSKDFIHDDLATPKVHKGEQAVIQSMVTSRNYDI